MALGLVLGGCTGRIGEPSATNTLPPGNNGNNNGNPDAGTNTTDPPVMVPVCDDTATLAASVPLRRINDLQYRNAIGALFNGLIAPSDAFPQTTLGLGYTTYSEANVMSALGTEQMLEAGEDIAEAVVQNLGRLLPCASSADEACARSFIDTYAERAFRRALRPDERELLLSLFRDVRGDTPFAESIGLVASAIVQMPQFLYLIEEQHDQNAVQKLNGNELATRLAFLMWNTLPDATLLAAADAGALSSKGGIEREVRRMLADPRAEQMISQFFHEWIDLGELSNGKDTSIYPEWNETLERSMEEEVQRFVAHVMSEKGGTLDALLTSNETYVNRPLAALYGLDPSISQGPNDWKLVTLDADQRAGLLTKAAMLAAKAHASTTSPVFRGKFVRQQLLCNEIPAPPPDAMAMAPEYPPNSTQREKSEILTMTQPCGGCHVLMNPIGLGFENYDALGKWRVTDTDGSNIDASGEVRNGSFTAFNGAVDLSKKLSTSAEARECIVRHWFRYSLGMREGILDKCSIERINKEAELKNYSLPELIVAIATSDAFMNRGTR